MISATGTAISASSCARWRDPQLKQWLREITTRFVMREQDADQLREKLLADYQVRFNDINACIRDT